MSEIDWVSVRDRAKEITEDVLSPLSYEELATALEDTHDDVGLAGGYIESAEGTILRKKDDGYSFNPTAIEVQQNATDEDKADSDSGEEVVGELSEVVESSRVVYPDELKERENWLCRTWDDKVPLAPWRSLEYNATWGDVELWSTFNEAKSWADKDKTTFQALGSDVDRLGLCFILNDEDGIPNGREQLSLIDLDDVRKSETGEVHPVALEVLERCNSYAELSQSGEGIHIIVEGSLPDHLGEFKKEIDDEIWVGDELPKIEIYDHSHVIAMVADLVDGCPNRVADGQENIDWILEEYGDDEHQDTRSSGSILDEKHKKVKTSSSGDYSVYWQISARDVLRCGSFPSVKSDREKNGEIWGGHPVHDSSSSGKDKKNFHADTDWYCFRCDTGGHGLELLAVEEFGSGSTACDVVGDEKTHNLPDLSDREFLELCLLARDKYSLVSEDTSPPARAISEVIEVADLPDEEYSLAYTVYENMSIDDI
ncbi:hypothetical protein [Halosimplex halobium]|uniref:hypothetical protein n=1 Tax=Halosimplex halobium TaxID=3396618 RepID=UPI003F55A3A1